MFYSTVCRMTVRCPALSAQCYVGYGLVFIWLLQNITMYMHTITNEITCTYLRTIFFLKHKHRIDTNYLLIAYLNRPILFNWIVFRANKKGLDRSFATFVNNTKNKQTNGNHSKTEPFQEFKSYCCKKPGLKTENKFSILISVSAVDNKSSLFFNSFFSQFFFFWTTILVFNHANDFD